MRGPQKETAIVNVGHEAANVSVQTLKNNNKRSPLGYASWVSHKKQIGMDNKATLTIMLMSLMSSNSSRSNGAMSMTSLMKSLQSTLKYLP